MEDEFLSGFMARALGVTEWTQRTQIVESSSSASRHLYDVIYLKAVFRFRPTALLTAIPSAAFYFCAHGGPCPAVTVRLFF